MAKSDKTVKRGVYLYIDGKEIKNDINSIDLEMKRLQRDIKEMTRLALRNTTAPWRRYSIFRGF